MGPSVVPPTDVRNFAQSDLHPSLRWPADPAPQSHIPAFDLDPFQKTPAWPSQHGHVQMGTENADDITKHSCCHVHLGVLLTAWLTLGTVAGWA
ncbi:hypothetical protein CB1_078722003 [Camelus ferus]|nr:hypothetical protein CB1_078722003 [Camelus ferus]